MASSHAPQASPPTLSPLLGRTDTAVWTALALAAAGGLLALYLRRPSSSSSPSSSTNSKNNTKTPMVDAVNPHSSLKSASESKLRGAGAPEHVSVSKILIHPIKSCRGTAVPSAHYTPEGLENDRKWCIIDATQLAVITAREAPKMVLITPHIVEDASSPNGGVLRVEFPEGSGCASFDVPLQPTEEVLKTWTELPKVTIWPTSDPIDGYICETPTPPASADLTPSAILTKYFEKPVHLIYKGPRPRWIDPTVEFPELKATAMYQDMYPLLVLSEESTGAVDEELKGRVGTQGIEETWRGARVVIERFRPNIVFRGGGPFAEDRWEEIAIGSGDAPRITLVSKCTRCLLPNVSPETGEKDKAVPYKVLMKFRTGLDPTHKLKPCVGCNAVPDGDGVVRVGDKVFVRKMIS